MKIGIDCNYNNNGNSGDIGDFAAADDHDADDDQAEHMEAAARLFLLLEFDTRLLDFLCMSLHASSQQVLL